MFKLYKDFINESELNEVLVQFGNTSDTKYGNVVIIAGGAGSGKGWTLKNVIGIDGINFNVDDFKENILKNPKLLKAIKKETGRDLSNLDLTQPEDVSMLHNVISRELGLPSKKMQTLLKSITSAHVDRKPNIIFDVTLKDIHKFFEIINFARDAGYNKNKIHIVWVLNDLEVAVKQNLSRDRVVPEDILKNTHVGASSTLNDILSMGDRLGKYMDGFIYILFNKEKVDNLYVQSQNPKSKNHMFNRDKETSGGYVEYANYLVVKEKNKKVKDFRNFSREILDKIIDYTKTDKIWEV